MRVQNRKAFLDVSFKDLVSYIEKNGSIPCIYSKHCKHENICKNCLYCTLRAHSSYHHIFLSRILSHSALSFLKHGKAHFPQKRSEVKPQKALATDYLSQPNLQYTQKRWIFLPLIAALFLLSSCGIYNGGFQRGGELTSSFLERIQENHEDEEDTLLPPHKEKKKCSKPSRKLGRK